VKNSDASANSPTWPAYSVTRKGGEYVNNGDFGKIVSIFKECTHGVFKFVIIILIVTEKKQEALIWYSPSHVIRLSDIRRNFMCGLKHNSRRCSTKILYILLAEYCQGFRVFLIIKA
jgi:hypothetical protein